MQLKYRLYEETDMKPSIVIGLDTQGRGQYIEKEGFERYEQKAMGAYVVFSRNYAMAGNLGFHLGLNKNLFENSDGDEDINLFLGLDKEINRSISLMIEYDAMLNDNNNEYDYEDLSLGKGIGYVNAGLRWSISDNLLLELNFNDINRNQKISETAHREFKILYSQKF